MFMPLCANRSFMITCIARYRRDYGVRLDIRDLRACLITSGCCRIRQGSSVIRGLIVPDRRRPRSSSPRRVDPYCQTLARQLSQLRERRIGGAGANIAGVLDHAVEPAIDGENGPFAQLAGTSVGFARGKTQAADITQPSADGALHRLGHRGIVYAAWIVEIGSHERQQFGAVVVGGWLGWGAPSGRVGEC